VVGNAFDKRRKLGHWPLFIDDTGRVIHDSPDILQQLH
jgi:hypothetical protein